MKKINYIAEITLPSKSAYSIQVMKMCDAFSLRAMKQNYLLLGEKEKLSINIIIVRKNLKNRRPKN